MLALSFLGTGNYQETTYQLGDKRCTTNLMPFAVQQFFEPEQLFVAQTKEASNTHGESLKAKCAYSPIDIPSGRTADELWQIFTTIANAIPENARLVIDVTHGFRSQPIIVLAIALYLQTAKNITIEKIIYGAFDGRSNDNITPVLDLTPAKPFAFLLDKVVNRFSLFSQTTNLFNEDGFQAQAQMIEFYLQTEQYQQAILLGREAIVSKVCVQHNFSALNREEREQAENMLRQWSEPLSRGQPVAKEHSQYKELATLWNKTIKIRNDIAHAGMNEDAAEAKNLIHRIKSTCKEIQEFLIKKIE